MIEKRVGHGEARLRLDCPGEVEDSKGDSSGAPTQREWRRQQARALSKSSAERRQREPGRELARPAPAQDQLTAATAACFLSKPSSAFDEGD